MGILDWLFGKKQKAASRSKKRSKPKGQEVASASAKVNEIRRLLKSNNIDALREIARSEGDALTAILITFLKDDHWRDLSSTRSRDNRDLRKQAARTLGELGNPLAAEALVAAAKERVTIIEGRAALIMRKFAPAKVEALEEEGLPVGAIQFTEDTLDEMAEMAQPAVNLLIPALKHEDLCVQRSAIQGVVDLLELFGHGEWDEKVGSRLREATLGPLQEIAHNHTDIEMRRSAQRVIEKIQTR